MFIFFLLFIYYIMKILKKSEYHNEGIFINLDILYNPYQNLLNNHNIHLNKSKKYYIYCKKGIKSKRVTAILEAYGYDVTLVID